MANVIEEAKSGRASCRTCRQAIGKGELRFGEEAANQFGDAPSMRWHHLPCAADKLPNELRAALDSYSGVIANRAELDQRMTDALAKGRAKPAGFPYADKAPTGRARCQQCQQPIDKDSLRVAFERELEQGAMVQSAAGYLHPTCVAAHIAAKGVDKAEFIAGVRANSRLAPADLDAALTPLST